MATRRESQNSVELFPFLAVLVCAMGALILLLLVMTRRIRQQAELRAEYERQQAVGAAAAPPVRQPVVAAAPPVVRRAPPQVIVRKHPPLPEPPPVYVDPTYEHRLAAQLRQHEEAVVDLRRTWQARVESLTAERGGLEANLQDLTAQLQQRETALESLQQSSAADRDDDSSADAAELARAVADLRSRSAAVRAEIDDAARQLQAKQAARAQQAAQSFTIIPFDARTGTSRRPIVIECRRDRVVLVGEEIELTAADLNGFIPHYNPLSAAVQTLVDGWSGRDGGDQPYVLLVVRPEGTVAFYAARMFLQPLNIPFGYELVGADQRFTWRATEPRLAAECRRSVDEVLRDRKHVAQLSQVSGKFEEPMRVAGAGGAFRLDEVDQMRQPARTVQFGGARLDRGQFTAGTGTMNATTPDKRALGLFRREPADANGDANAAANATPAPVVTAMGRGSEASDTAPGESDPQAAFPHRDQWMNDRRFQRSQKVQDPYNWRPPTRSGISVQRDVPVEITGEVLRVAGGESIAITAGTDVETLARHVAEGLEGQLADWGDPPHGFYWSPRLKLIVSSDGAVLSGKLAPIIETWGLESTLDYASKFSRTAGAPRTTR